MVLSLVTKTPAQTIGGSIKFPTLSQVAPIPLRLIVGYGFIMHGYAKLHRGPETFAVILQTIGVPLPLLMAWLTSLVELIGGFAILLGAFVPVVSLPMMVVLLTALFTIHLPYGFFSVKLVEVTATGTKFGSVGYEIILLYLASLVALVFGGAGWLSVDQWRLKHKFPYRGSRSHTCHLLQRLVSYTIGTSQ
jgi:putative oxidoreductase